MFDRLIARRPRRLIASGPRRLIAVWLMWVCTWCLPRPALSRWATEKDVESITHLSRTEYRVRADGGYVATYETLIEVRTDDGRQSQGTFRRSYNGRAQVVTVLAAETRNGDRVVPVEGRFIEDKPLASAPGGFSERRQVVVVFPEVKVGSRLFLRLREEEREPGVVGSFGRRLYFGWDELERDTEVVVRSALPLRHVVNDPTGKLEVTESREGAEHVVRGRLLGPVHVQPIDEPSGFVGPARLVYLDVSSHAEWAGYFARLAAAHEAVVGAPLPPEWAAIAARARGEKGPEAQMDAVLSGVAAELRYQGDWRPVRGGYVPRPLLDIAASRFGDCKDLAAAAVAILRALGYRAQMAVIERGARPNRYEGPGLPMLSAFNHAIAYVEVKGRSYYLDGTNPVAYARGVPEDLMDRPVLVLDPAGARLLRVPAGEPGDAEQTERFDLDLRQLGELRAVGTWRLGGRAALSVAGDELNYSRETIGYRVVGRFASRDRLLGWSVEGYDLKGRVARDVTFEVKYRERGPDLRTSAGAGVWLSEGVLAQRLLTPVEGRVSDLELGRPGRLVRERYLRGIRLVGRAPGCVVEGPWARLVRRVEPQAGGVLVRDELETRRWVVPNGELVGARFRALQEEVRACFDGVVLVYEQAAASPAQAAAP